MHRALCLVAALIFLAGTVPALRVGFSSRPPALDLPTVDSNALRVLSKIAPSAHVVAAIVVDVDHDGDLDVVARTTDDVLAIWVNEGHDRFVKYQPDAAPKMTSAAEVSPPLGHGLAPATPARAGYEGYLVASGFARPPTTKSGVPANARTVRLDQCSNPSSGRAPPPSVSSL